MKLHENLKNNLYKEVFKPLGGTYVERYGELFMQCFWDHWNLQTKFTCMIYYRIISRLFWRLNDVI